MIYTVGKRTGKGTSDNITPQCYISNSMFVFNCLLEGVLVSCIVTLQSSFTHNRIIKLLNTYVYMLEAEKQLFGILIAHVHYCK